MYEVRQNIKKVWLDYAVGRITFAAAALTTETGFAVMRLAEDQFLETYPDLQEFLRIIKFMHMQVTTIRQTCLIYPERYV